MASELGFTWPSPVRVRQRAVGGLEAGGAEASLLHCCPNSPRGLCGCPERPHPRPTSQRAQSRSEHLQPGKMRKRSILIFKGCSCKVLASLCYKVAPSAFGSAGLGYRAENNFRQAQGGPELHPPVRPSQELPQGRNARGHVSGRTEPCSTSAARRPRPHATLRYFR